MFHCKKHTGKQYPLEVVCPAKHVRIRIVALDFQIVINNSHISHISWLVTILNHREKLCKSRINPGLTSSRLQQGLKKQQVNRDYHPGHGRRGKCVLNRPATQRHPGTNMKALIGFLELPIQEKKVTFRFLGNISGRGASRDLVYPISTHTVCIDISIARPEKQKQSKSH